MVLIFFDPLKRGFIPWEVFTVMLSALSVCQNSLDEIKISMTPLSYNTWVATMTPICIKDSTLVLQVKDPSTKNTLKSIYTQTLTDCINRANSGTYLVRFIDESELPLYNAYREDKPVAGSDYYLNPKYTFESFVVGNSNIFAHAAAQAVAEEPGKAYNPLFIYGGVGLGKTHLMHAIGHRILQNNPSARIVYITTETFTNDLIQSIQENSRVQFRNKYRTADVLIIDDIQFLVAKDRTQEEFFNTFNALHTYGKQIIISSDKAPKDLINLEDRLVSRFEGGLVADIQPPDLETRVAILKRKAQSEQIDVSEDVLTFIAEKVNSNIRQLEGSLIRVIAFARLTKKPIDLALTATALKDIVAGYDNTPVTIPLVQQVVSDYYDIDTDALLSQRRSMDVTYPRQMAMYLCKELTNKPLKAIGASFGGRDHSTVINACKRIETDMKNDPQVADLVEDLTKRIKKQ